MIDPNHEVERLAALVALAEDTLKRGCWLGGRPIYEHERVQVEVLLARRKQRLEELIAVGDSGKGDKW